jgi:hypothetical protein
MFAMPFLTASGRAAALSVLLVCIGAPAEAGGWYFYVQNSSKSAITRLQVREKGGSWADFDLDGGIAAGRKVRIDWAKSTDNQDCKQSLRASFADGSSSEPAMFDFCEALDTPNVFEY